MKKKVIQINGLHGLLLTLFIIACLVAGFVCFPAMMCTHIWNYFASKILFINNISFCGGLLLWGIIALSFFILNKKNLVVSFSIPNNISKEELSELFKRAEIEKPEEVLKEFEKRHSQTSSEKD